MLGRTHFFIGTAAALAVLQPQTVPALVAGAGAAAIGGLISDIDVGTSQAHRDADKIITATVAVAVLTILAEYKLNLGIYRRLTSDSSVLRLLTGTAAFLLICAYGKQQPHRSFMHSFAALALLTACVDIIYPDASAYFAVGFLFSEFRHHGIRHLLVEFCMMMECLPSLSGQVDVDDPTVLLAALPLGVAFFHQTVHRRCQRSDRDVELCRDR